MKKTTTVKVKDNIELILHTMPAMLYFFVFCYIPMFGIVLAFQNYKYDTGFFSEWVGLKNFEFFFTSGDLQRIVTNTIFYGVLFIITGIITGVGLALLMYEIKNRLLLKAYQTVVILPNFLSWVIVAFITYIFLNHSYGVANQILAFFGRDPIQWYSDRKYWPYILTYVNIWKCVGI